MRYETSRFYTVAVYVAIGVFALIMASAVLCDLTVDVRFFWPLRII